MKKEIKVPDIGESITGGIITCWLMQNGDTVEEGEAIFELETEKATLDIPATDSGVLEILVEEGPEVKVGQTVAVLREQNDKSAEPSTIASQEPANEVEQITQAVPESSIEETKGKPADFNVDVIPDPNRRTETVPMSMIHKKTAQRLVRAKQTTAYLTTFNEIDMQKGIDIRTHYKTQFQEEHGIRIGFMSFFIKACCQALKEFPGVNSRIDGDNIVYNYFYDIGVAISIEEGLLVPIIRDADKLHFAQIESAIADLAKRANEKKVLPSELTGGTFTITNGGVFGSLMSTPIPAFPQTAILGMHTIKKRPVVIDDQVVIRPMMFVALSYDHQVIDGRQAVGFLANVKNYIEDPDKLLLEL